MLPTTQALLQEWNGVLHFHFQKPPLRFYILVRKHLMINY